MAVGHKPSSHRIAVIIWCTPTQREIYEQYAFGHSLSHQEDFQATSNATRGCFVPDVHHFKTAHFPLSMK